MIEFLFVERYSMFEMAIAITLAAIPMSRISELLVGLFMQRIGIELTHKQREVLRDHNEDEEP